MLLTARDQKDCVVEGLDAGADDYVVKPFDPPVLRARLQALLRRLGDLLVVLLTQVVGRSIGLVGRGIRQGLGRSLSRG